MYEPLRCIFFAVVETCSEKPKPPAGGVLHHIIIAGGLCCTTPPFWRDTFWTSSIGNLMQNAAPAELTWRTFRNEGDDVCNLGARQQHEGTRA